MRVLKAILTPRCQPCDLTNRRRLPRGLGELSRSKQSILGVDLNSMRRTSCSCDKLDLFRGAVPNIRGAIEFIRSGQMAGAGWGSHKLH